MEEATVARDGAEELRLLSDGGAKTMRMKAGQAADAALRAPLGPRLRVDQGHGRAHRQGR